MADYKLTTKKTWTQSLNELEFVLQKWGAVNFDCNYPWGARSESYNQAIDDRRVTISYIKGGAETRLTMDKQRRAVDNLRVLFLCIESIYMNERRGLGDVIKEAYAQLPAPVTERDPYEVLGLFSDSPIEVCESVYKTLAQKYHPDVAGTGDERKFKEIKTAIDKIRRKVK